jgi:hypothetical protein
MLLNRTERRRYERAKDDATRKRLLLGYLHRMEASGELDPEVVRFIVVENEAISVRQLGDNAAAMTKLRNRLAGASPATQATLRPRLLWCQAEADRVEAEHERNIATLRASLEQGGFEWPL